jgi:hypothetical protein
MNPVPTPHDCQLAIQCVFNSARKPRSFHTGLGFGRHHVCMTVVKQEREVSEGSQEAVEDNICAGQSAAAATAAAAAAGVALHLVPQGLEEE